MTQLRTDFEKSLKKENVRTIILDFYWNEQVPSIFFHVKTPNVSAADDWLFHFSHW